MFVIPATAGPGARLSHRDYRHLLALRTGLRRFLRWSEDQARAAGLTAGQHQLLLAVHGHDNPKGPTIGEVADYLVVRHHSAVGLVDRAQDAGLVLRRPDPDRHGTVRLVLTDHGRACLQELSALHLEELVRLAPTMEALWRTLGVIAPEQAAGEPPRR